MAVVEEDQSTCGDTVCSGCGSPDGGDTMLLCDACDEGWHLDCLEVLSYLMSDSSGCRSVVAILELLGKYAV